MKKTILLLMTIVSLVPSAKGLDPDIVRKTLMSRIPLMRKCYQDEMSKSGKTFNYSPILHFKVNAQGSVQSSNIELAQSAPESKVTKLISLCVNDVLKSTKFPKPEGGGVVEVNQPLNFKPIIK